MRPHQKISPAATPSPCGLFNITLFLGNAFEIARQKAPEWTSNPEAEANTKPYTLAATEADIGKIWPADMAQNDFSPSLSRFIISKLGVDRYDQQTQTGWFLAAITNLLVRQGQSDFIFSEVLPEIYTRQEEKNSLVKVLGRMLPAMREQLDEAALPGFEKNQHDLLNSVFATKDLYVAATRLISYMHDGSGLGRYTLSEGCAAQTAFLFKTLPIPVIVDRFGQSSGHWMVSALMCNLFKNASPEQGQTLALALHDQLKPQGLIKTTQQLLKDNAGPIALGFNSGLLTALPSQQKEIYAKELLTLNWSPYLVEGAIFNPEPSASFIKALPEGLAQKMVRGMVDETMGFELEASPNYWWQSKYADRLHQMVPERYWPVCEEVVLEHLSAYPSDRDCLIRASLILRGILANDQTCRTHDVDFIHVPFYSPYRSHVVFVRPLPDRIDSGIVMINNFIGTMSDLEESIRNPATGMPRDQPPHRREIYPVERYAPYIETIKAGMGGTPDTQVSLRETLRRRQQYHLRIQPRRALPAPG